MKRKYVNNDYYIDDRYYPRVRFSFAHELGHLILHKTTIENLDFDSVDDYISFQKNAPHVGKQPRERTSKGIWRKKRADTGKKRK